MSPEHLARKTFYFRGHFAGLCFAFTFALPLLFSRCCLCCSPGALLLFPGISPLGWRARPGSRSSRSLSRKGLCGSCPMGSVDSSDAAALSPSYSLARCLLPIASFFGLPPFQFSMGLSTVHVFSWPWRGAIISSWRPCFGAMRLAAVHFPGRMHFAAGAFCGPVHFAACSRCAALRRAVRWLIASE
jgi:hypothetical protein